MEQTALFSFRLQMPAGQTALRSGSSLAIPAAAEAAVPDASVPEATDSRTEAVSDPEPVSEGIVWSRIEIPEAAPAPGEKGDGGKIREMKMSPGRQNVEGVSFTNRSARTNLDIAGLLQQEIALQDTGEEPLVLLMHTHTTKSYMAYDAGYYNKSDPSRTQDEGKNVTAIGEIVATRLRDAGIPVLHDVTVHDYPQYSNAYSRSLTTVKKILQQHPSIQIVIDLHRDGIMADETTKVKPTVVIDGKKTAQVMLLVGLSDTASVPNPGWKNNLTIAARLQQYADASGDGLMRPMILRDGRFNQHTAPYCFLVEMDSDSNTLPEAMRAADLFGRRLALFLKEETVFS